MAFDVEAAKADGYTDEEIRQYMETKDQPLPPEQPRDRSEEQLGIVQAAVPSMGGTAMDLAKLGAELYAGKKLIVDPIAGALKGNATPPVAAPTPAAAPAPTTFTGGANPAWDEALSRPHPQATPLATAPEAPPSASNYMQRMTQLAERYMPAAKSVASTAGRVIEPVARVLGSTPVMGAQLMTYSPGLNANEEQELARRRAMQPTFNFPQQ